MAALATPRALGALRGRLDEAVRRARVSGTERLAAVTVEIGADVDPSAVAFASRRPGEPWFCFEQPDRDGAALATLGCVKALEGSGAGRFGSVARAWRSLASNAVSDDAEGLLAVGGFAFADAGGSTPDWSGFAHATDLVGGFQAWRAAGLPVEP